MTSKLKIGKKQFLIALFFAILTFVFLINSPLHPFGNAESGTDSSVFRTVAMMMRKGYMPYRDSFDHKGPLLYLINYIGMVLSENHGVWVIEYMALLITTFMFFHIAKIINDNYIQNTISVLVALSLLSDYFEGGNLTEEYAMPFLAVALYIFLDYLINKKVTNIRLFVCGICLGAVCLLRANMVGLWIVFCIAIFMKEIYEKQYKALIRYVVWFILGFCTIILPIITWLHMNNALKDFWFDYIRFNSEYSSSAGGKEIIIAIYFFSFTIVYLLSLQMVIFLFLKKKNCRFLYGSYCVYMIINLLLLTMSGRSYPHYGMVLIPSVVFPIASLLKYISKRYDRILLYFVVIFLICNTILKPCFKSAKSIYLTLKSGRNISKATEELIDVIVNNSAPDEKISVYGNCDIYYIFSDRMHATKYSYQFPIGIVDSAIMEEYWTELKEEKPKLIVIPSQSYCDEGIISFLDKNSYTLLWSGDEGEMDKRWVYVKNQ